MAKTDKDAKELVELAAEQGGHAAKNVGRAAAEVVQDIIPNPTSRSREGVAVALSVGPKTLTGLTAIGGGIVAYRVGKRVIELKKARDAKKELEKAEKPVKPVVTEHTRGRDVA